MKEPPTIKQFECTSCGHITKQVTNHYGRTYSLCAVDVCSNCPHSRDLTFGGVSEWRCIDKPAVNVYVVIDGNKLCLDRGESHGGLLLLASIERFSRRLYVRYPRPLRRSRTKPAESDDFNRFRVFP